MVKTSLIKMKWIFLLALALGLSSCLRTAEKDSSAQDTVQPGDKYGVCVVEVEEATKNPKNKIFISQNKKFKCTSKSKCYHLVVQGTCDYVNTPYVRIDAMERNSENFSANPEKNGSYRYSTDVICVGATYKADLWLQLKGIDNFEIKNTHYENKKAYKEDPENYIFMVTDTYLPDFDPAKSEVFGFFDKSTNYNDKLSLCQRKYPLLYTKPQAED